MARKKIDDNQIEMIIVEKSEGKGPAELVILPKAPVKAIRTKDNVSNFIAQNMLDAGEQLLEMEKKGRIKQQIKTRVSFSYEGIDILAKKEFTLFDQEVHDAVVTLHLAGNKFISPSMVYRAMTGKSNSEYIHSAKLKKIEESIDKSMFSKLSIDASEAEAVLGREQSLIYSGALLSAEKASVTMGGHKIVAYMLNAEPLLYRYAKACNQISSVDIKLLNTPVQKNDETIVLQGYLLRRIENIKYDRKKDRTILFDDIYRVLDVGKDQKVRTKRIREYTKEILGFWAKNGYISNFEYIKKGGMYYEIIIYHNFS